MVDRLAELLHKVAVCQLRCCRGDLLGRLFCLTDCCLGRCLDASRHAAVQPKVKLKHDHQRHDRVVLAHVENVHDSLKPSNLFGCRLPVEGRLIRGSNRQGHDIT